MKDNVENSKRFYRARFSGSLPDAVLEAKIELYTAQALAKAKDKSKANSFVSSSLQQLNRDIRNYKQDIHTPEQFSQESSKVKAWADTYAYTYNKEPDLKTIAGNFSISEKKAKELLESSTGSAFVDMQSQNKTVPLTSYIKYLPEPHQSIAQEVYANKTTTANAMRKLGLKKTTFFKQKKEMDQKLRNLMLSKML